MAMSSTNPIPASAARAPSRWRERLVGLGLLAMALFGLAMLASATGWEETIAELRKIRLGHLAVLLLLSLANYLLRGLRWHIFARRLGLATGFLQDLRHFLGGFAMSVTPGRLGELVRMRWLRRETGWPFARTAPLVLVDRASDLAAMAVILGVGIGFSARGIAGALPVTLISLTIAVVATRPRLLAMVADLGYRLTGRRWPRLFGRLRFAARSLSRFSGPMMLAIAALIGAAGWFAEAFAFHLLLGWMGVELDLGTAAAIFIFATLAGGVTGAPGGVGGAEATMVALLALEHVPLDAAIAATTVIRLTTLWFAIAIGVIVFPLAERHSRKVHNALEKN